MTIVLSDITKRFGDQLVVSNLSLQVQDRELFVLLGSSGSGKSTILRVIAGLIDPDSGVVQLHGRDVTRLPTQQRGVGFVFQSYAIFRHMTVAGNVEFGLKIRKVAPKDRQRRRDEILELVGLGGLGDRLPHELSGGQRQRVALARALVYEPSVLLLDEPFGALDLKIRLQLRRTLREIQRQLGVTTILVTHDQEEAFELGDRIGVLERGRLLEVGTPERLYHHPATEYVATFLGGGNVLVGKSEGGRIRLGAALLPMPVGSPAHEEGAPVRILFRPETVVVSERAFPENSGIRTLGQGRFVDKTFAGGVERLRVEMEALRGARPLEPALVYGQRNAVIEVARPSTLQSVEKDNHVWIGVPAFHVLQPSGIKLLAFFDSVDRAGLVPYMANQIGLASHGPIVCLAVVKEAASFEAGRASLRGAVAASMDATALHLEFKVREGRGSEELIREAQETFYDIVVVAWREDEEEGGAQLETLVKRLLVLTGTPVLITAQKVTSFRRILICTAGGEPGKSDVQFGARLARHTKSDTTVMHVAAEHASSEERQRVERHLTQAKAALEAYNIRSEVKIGREPRIPSILAEVRDGGYDLVIVGAPGTWRRGRPNLIAEIVTRCRTSVLIVPS